LVPNRLHFESVKAVNGRASDGSFLNFSEFVNVTCVLGVMGTDELTKVGAGACGWQHCHPHPAPSHGPWTGRISPRRGPCLGCC